MDKKANTKWFLHCTDDTSNESVAESIGGLHGTTNGFKLTKCADGVPRYLYEVSDYQFAKRFVNRSKKLFKMFTSQNDGKPKAWEAIVKNKKSKISFSEIKKRSDAIVQSALQHKQR